ncbi:MAG: hypothetical protein ACREMH_11395 [Gemmatimonadales bacterium]
MNPLPVRSPARLSACAAAALLLALVAPAAAAQEISRGFRIDDDAAIRIFNLGGTITVRGWDRDSIAITGRVPAADATFYAGGQGAGAKLGVEPKGKGTVPPRSDLRVFVPRNARVWIKTDEAVIDVAGVAGQVDAFSVGGRVKVTGPVRALSIESMDGAVEVEGQMGWVRLKSAGGAVRFSGASDDLAASSVSGTVVVAAIRVGRGRIETVTGDIRFSGLPERTGTLAFETHAGRTEVLLPRNAAVDVDLNTLGGTITNTFTQRQPKPGQAGRGSVLTFATDIGGAAVSVRSFKGDILVGPAPPATAAGQ